MTDSYPRVTLFGLQFFGGSQSEFLFLLQEHLRAPFTKTFVICTPNPEQVILAQHQPQFRQDLEHADYLLPDGGGLITASRLQGEVPFLTARIPGVEIVSELLAKDEMDTHRFLVMGGRGYDHKKTQEGWSLQDVSQMSGEELSQVKASPVPKTLYWLTGYENVAQPTPKEEDHLSEVIRAIQPEIIFVAFGAPYQERFIAQHSDLFNNNQTKIVMAVGGSFDFLTGKIKRAPLLVQELGLEWCYRLVKEPWRWKRQLRLIEFSWLTIKTIIQS